MPAAVGVGSAAINKLQAIGQTLAFAQQSLPTVFTRQVRADPVRFQLVGNNVRQGSEVMLVLTRQVGETILIGEDIVIEVVAVGPGRVRLGIAAPRNVSIVRGELKKVEGAVVAPSPATRQSPLLPFAGTVS